MKLLPGVFQAQKKNGEIYFGDVSWQTYQSRQLFIPGGSAQCLLHGKPSFKVGDLLPAG